MGCAPALSPAWRISFWTSIEILAGFAALAGLIITLVGLKGKPDTGCDIEMTLLKNRKT